MRIDESAEHGSVADQGLSYMSPEQALVHIVDDDELVRTALVNLLSAAGHEARAYGSAAEFLHAVPEDTPGCVVLDVLMPGDSGFGVPRNADASWGCDAGDLPLRARRHPDERICDEGRRC